MTSAGAEVYRQQAVGFSPNADVTALDRELDRRLLAHFRFEFLNRLDDVVHFHPLGRAHIRTIALRELDTITERVGFRGRDLKLEVDEAVLDWLAVHGHDPLYGARFLRRIIERSVTTCLPGWPWALALKGHLKLKSPLNANGDRLEDPGRGRFPAT